MLERGFRLRVLEGLCDVGLVVELGLGLGNWRGGEREPDGGEGGCLRGCVMWGWWLSWGWGWGIGVEEIENQMEERDTSSPAPRLLLHSISSVPPPAPAAQLLVSSSNLHFLGSASSLSLRDTRRANDQPRPLKSQPLSLPCRAAVLSASLTPRRQIFSLLNSQLLSLGQSVTPSPVSLSPRHAATHITIACSSAESTNMMENEEVMGGTSDPVDKLVDVEIDLAESQLDDLTEDIMKMDINKENNDEPPSMGSNADMV
uniref:Uncharacterized protein n=1 Tax=Fagus sylvatica TaxID=28930 RepID=A0A2N9HC94_FAGSY